MQRCWSSSPRQVALVLSALPDLNGSVPCLKKIMACFYTPGMFLDPHAAKVGYRRDVFLGQLIVASRTNLKTLTLEIQICCSLQQNRVLSRIDLQPQRCRRKYPQSAQEPSRLYGWLPGRLYAYEFQYMHPTKSGLAQLQVECFLICALCVGHKATSETFTRFRCPQS